MAPGGGRAINVSIHSSDQPRRQPVAGILVEPSQGGACAIGRQRIESAPPIGAASGSRAKKNAVVPLRQRSSWKSAIGERLAERIEQRESPARRDSIDRPGLIGAALFSRAIEIAVHSLDKRIGIRTIKRIAKGILVAAE